MVMPGIMLVDDFHGMTDAPVYGSARCPESSTASVVGGGWQLVQGSDEVIKECCSCGVVRDVDVDVPQVLEGAAEGALDHVLEGCLVGHELEDLAGNLVARLVETGRL